MSTWMFKAVFSIKPQQEILLSFSVRLQTVASTTHSNKGTRKSSKKWCCTWEELHRARRGIHTYHPKIHDIQKDVTHTARHGVNTYHPKVQDVQEDVVQGRQVEGPPGKVNESRFQNIVKGVGGWGWGSNPTVEHTCTNKTGAVAHACNPIIPAFGREGRRITMTSSRKLKLTVRPCLTKQNHHQKKKEPGRNKV